MVIAEKATGTIGRQVKAQSSLNDHSFNDQASDRGLCGDDAVWELLCCPGSYGKLYQQYSHLLWREYLHKVHTTHVFLVISIWETKNTDVIPLLLLYILIKAGMSIPDWSGPQFRTIQTLVAILMIPSLYNNFYLPESYRSTKISKAIFWFHISQFLYRMLSSVLDIYFNFLTKLK